jgi:hypothetical protein
MEKKGNEKRIRPCFDSQPEKPFCGRGGKREEEVTYSGKRKGESFLRGRRGKGKKKRNKKSKSPLQQHIQ